MRYLFMAMWAMLMLAAMALIVMLGPAVHAQPVHQPISLTYISPTPNSQSVSAGTTISVRAKQNINPASISSNLFAVVGSSSGVHVGTVVLARDGQTVIFKPERPFTPAESVAVTINAGLQLTSEQPVAATTWHFTVSPKPYPYTNNALAATALSGPTTSVRNAGSCVTVNLCSQVSALAPNRTEGASAATAPSVTEVITSLDYVTAPDFLPRVVVTRTDATLGNGSIFWAPFWSSDPSNGSYLTILNDRAELIYYRRLPNAATDFKRQPNGQLTYFSTHEGVFFVLNNAYNHVDTWSAGNGLVTDLHELQLLPNGHALLMIYDNQPLDLSSIGGRPDAIVIDLVIQELDQDKNVVFEWNSRDHIAITDTFAPLTDAVVDYAHGNAIELDTDGNLLISSRHLSEITKIDRSTGAILWRLGGKHNQFTFIGDLTLPGIGGFSFQHDIRRLSNGHITLFDNGNQFMFAGLRNTRGVEYVLDETAKTATFVQEFRTDPDMVSLFMGNMQRLSNENTLIGWGGGTFGSPGKPPAQAMTEFNPNGQPVFSLRHSGLSYISYRAFRFPWQAVPATPPTLVAITTTNPISLYYSWNGATEVVSYTVAGGVTPGTLTSFATQPKTGFEDSTALQADQAVDCFFQITPMQKNGVAGLPSNIAYRGDASCSTGLTAQADGAASRTFALPAEPGPVTVTLSLDTGSVVSPTIFVLLPSAANEQPLPTGLLPIGPMFEVSAHDEGGLASGVVVQDASVVKPLRLTIDYSATNAPHVLGINLVRWDAATLTWTSSEIAVVANDTVNKRLTVDITGTGTFALITTNQAPTSTGVAWVVTPEDTAYAFKVADFPYSDADGDPLAEVSLLSLPVSGTLTLAGNPVVAGAVVPAAALAQLVYTPPANANGAPFASFAYTIGDGFTAAGPYTATIQVLPVNDAPVAVDDVEEVAAAGTSASPQFSSPVVIDVLGNDYDTDGDALTITAIGAPAHGTVARFGDAIQYTPDAGFTGSDEFTYTIADGNGGTATAAVRIADLADALFIPLLKNNAR